MTCPNTVVGKRGGGSGGDPGFVWFGPPSGGDDSGALNALIAAEAARASGPRNVKFVQSASPYLAANPVNWLANGPAKIDLNGQTLVAQMVSPGGGAPQPALFSGEYGHSVTATSMVAAAKAGDSSIRIVNPAAVVPNIAAGSVIGLFSSDNSVSDQLYTVKQVVNLAVNDWRLDLLEDLVDDYPNILVTEVISVTKHPVGKTLDMSGGTLTGVCARLWSFPFAWNCVLENGTLDDSAGAPGQAGSFDLAGRNNAFVNVQASFSAATELILECNDGSQFTKVSGVGLSLKDDSSIRTCYEKIALSLLAGQYGFLMTDDQGKAVQNASIENFVTSGGAGAIIGGVGGVGVSHILGLAISGSNQVWQGQLLNGKFKNLALDNVSGTPQPTVGQPWIVLDGTTGVVSNCKLLAHAPAAANPFDDRYLVATNGSGVTVLGLSATDASCVIFAQDAGTEVLVLGGASDSSSRTVGGTTFSNFVATNGATVSLKNVRHVPPINAFCIVLNHSAGGVFVLEDWQTPAVAAGYDIFGDATGGVWIGANCTFGVPAGFSPNARPSQGVCKLALGVVTIPFPPAKGPQFPKLFLKQAIGTWGVQYLVATMDGVGAGVTSLLASGALAGADNSYLYFEF